MASNQEIEAKAIEAVNRYEMSEGRQPQLVSSPDVGYDILSGGRKIEVKGTDGGDIFSGFVVEEQQFDMFKDPNFWLYRVLHVSSGEPEVIPIRPDELNFTKPQVRYNATSWKDKRQPRVSRLYQEFKEKRRQR